MMRAICVIGLIGAAAVAPQQSSLKELARANGGIASQVVSLEVPVRSLVELMNEADLVLRAKVVTATPALSRDETTVETEYTLEPLQVLVARKTTDRLPRPGATRILFRRAGGKLTTEGLHLTTEVNIFPADAELRPDEEGVFFLRYDPGQDVYRLLDGPFGALRVQWGEVRSLTSEAAEQRSRIGTPVGGSIAALLEKLERIRERQPR